MTDKLGAKDADEAIYQKHEEWMNNTCNMYAAEIKDIADKKIEVTPEYAAQRLTEISGVKKLRGEKKETRKVALDRTRAQYEIEIVEGMADRGVITGVEKAVDKYEASLVDIEVHANKYEQDLDALFNKALIPAAAGAGGKAAPNTDYLNAIKTRYDLEADARIREEQIFRGHLKDDLIDKAYQLEMIKAVKSIKVSPEDAEKARRTAALELIKKLDRSKMTPEEQTHYDASIKALEI